MERPARVVASIISAVIAAVASFLVLVPTGCDDVGGVPSWERCTSALGLPAFSVEDLGLDATLNILIPLLMAVVVGWVVWAATGLSGPDN